MVLRALRDLLIVGLLGVGLLGALWFARAQDVRSPWAPPAVLPPETPSPPAPIRTNVSKKPAKVAPPSNGKPGADATMIIPAEVFIEPRPIRGVVEEEPNSILQTGVQAPSLPAPKPPALPDIAKPIDLPMLENKGPANPPPPMFPQIAQPITSVPPPLPALEPKAGPDMAPPKPAPAAPPLPALEPKGISGSSSVDGIIVVPPPTAEPMRTLIAEPGTKEPLKFQPSPVAAPPVPVPLAVPEAKAFAPVPDPKPTVVVPSPVFVPETRPLKDGPKAFVLIRPASRPIEPRPNPLPPIHTPPPAGPIATPPPRGPSDVQLQTPALIVEKRQTTQRVGNTLQYQILVRNLSSFPAQQVRIEDEIPLDARLTAADPVPAMQAGQAVWTLATVAPGSEQIIRLTVQTSAIDITHRTSVHVSAATSAKPAINQSAYALRPRNQTEALAVRLLAPTNVAVGKPVVFDVQVTNQSDQPCNGMVLFGTLPDGLTHPLGQYIKGPFEGTLQPGETKTLRMPATAVKPGRYTVEVKVATNTGYEASATANISIDPDTLHLVQALNARLFVGREGDYRIELTNHTNRPMRNVAIANLLPEGLEFIGASDRGLYQANRRAVHWLVDELPAGRTHILTMRVHATKVGQYQHVVTAKADGSPEVRSVGVITVEGVAGLSMKVIDRDNPLEVGRETVYEIQVANPGTTPSTNVKLQVQFPPGLTPRNAQGDTRHTVNQQTIVFDPLPALGPQGQAIYRVSALAESEGFQRVRFAIVSAQLQTPIIREQGTKVYRD